MNRELALADVGVALEAAGERLPVVPAVDGVDTLPPIPLLTEPEPPPLLLELPPPPCSLSHFANSALTRSVMEREEASEQESFEESFAAEEVSSCFLLPLGCSAAEDVLEDASLFASGATASSDSVAAAAAAPLGAATGIFLLAEEATCSSPSLGSWGRSEALALMAIVGGWYLSDTEPKWGLLRLLSGGDLRQPGVVGDLRRGSALGTCRDEGFAAPDGVLGDGAAAVVGADATGSAADAATANPTAGDEPWKANRGSGSDMGSDEEEEVEFLSCDDSRSTPAAAADDDSKVSGFSSSTGVPGLLLLLFSSSSGGSGCWFPCRSAAAAALPRNEGLWEPCRAESLEDDL